MAPVRPIIAEVPAVVPPDAQLGAGMPRAQGPAGQRRATLVDTPARFSAFLEGLALSGPRAIGLDTETANVAPDALYRESPSLLQLAFRHRAGDVRVGVIDLLAIRDVRALQSHLAHPQVVVFAHNYAYDERMLLRLGLRPRCVYDTCRAARLLYEGAGRLADLSERLLETPLPKELQGSDWGRRPLSWEQVAYAARDAADTLAVGEMVRALLPEVPQPLPALNPAARAAYRALVAWRAEVAAAARRFPEDVLPQRTLREVAAQRPSTPDELRRIPGIGEKRLERYGAGILATLAAVELAALVGGTALSRLSIAASALAADGLHVRLAAQGARAGASPFAPLQAAAVPPCVRAALGGLQPWRRLRPALAGLRLSCAVETAGAGTDDAGAGSEEYGRIVPLFSRPSV